MHPTSRSSLVVFLLAAAAGCSEATGPDSWYVMPKLAISDGANQGLPGFYFQAPLVPTPTTSGTFDPDLDPVVDICATTACETLLASFTRTSGTESETVRVSTADQSYVVNWNTGRTGAVVGSLYRVRVRVGARVLGFADVGIGANGKEAKNLTNGDMIGLVDGRTLPIRFRIEKGIPGSVEVEPSTATVLVSETQQFSATVYDLHGVALPDASVTWVTNDALVAEVDTNGLATGISEGTATVTASHADLTGSASIDVVTGGPWLFTTCGALGASGPTASACATAYAETDLEGLVTVNSGKQSWNVPATARYRITATGAQGASANSERVGGMGAKIVADFDLTAGATLHVVVGQAGTGQGSGTNGGGGGGSFVVAGSTPLLVAGGGGGARVLAGQNGCDASLTAYGRIGSTNSTSTCATRTSTLLGLGGLLASTFARGSAGAGFNGDGQNDSTHGLGGRSWANGMTGGTEATACGGGFASEGGFGGGGSGNGCYGGGGGGGYSGGDGGYIAGGGGSYSATTLVSAVIATVGGPGSILIERLP